MYLRERSQLSSQDNKWSALLVLEAVGDQLALAHVEQPVQLSPAVLPAVEGCEPAQLKLNRAKLFCYYDFGQNFGTWGSPVDAALKFCGEGENAGLLEWPTSR